MTMTLQVDENVREISDTIAYFENNPLERRNRYYMLKYSDVYFDIVCRMLTYGDILMPDITA